MENCLCHTPATLTIAPPPSAVPDASRRFDAVRRALFAEFAKVVVAGGFPIRQLATSHPQALGNVIPEAWAIISEILAFYDVLITRDLFIGSASTRANLQRLAELLGYLPRPAVASNTHIALLGSQLDTPTSTVGLTLRAALPSPQIFEPDGGKSLSWIPRTVTLDPIRNTVLNLDDSPANKKITLLLEATTAAPQRGLPVLFLFGNRMRATEILEVKPSQELDGTDYVEISVTDPATFNISISPPFLGTDVDVHNVSVMSPSQRAYTRTKLFGESGDILFDYGLGLTLSDEDTKDALGYKPGGYGPAFNGKIIETLTSATSTIELDTVYRNIKTADMVIVQRIGKFSAHRVTNTEEALRHVEATGDPVLDESKPKLPITVLTLNPVLPAEFKTLGTEDKLIIHYNFHDIGRLMQPAYSEVTPKFLHEQTEPLPLAGVHRGAVGTEHKGKWLLEDAVGRGALVDATMKIGERGKATLQITPDPEDPNSPLDTTTLRVPIVAHPNVLHITRGETVKDEVLGNGNPNQPFQSFTLKKSPLTYYRDESVASGVRTTLAVHVNGVKWHERRTFYGAGPNDNVYIVRQDEDEKSTVTFGDGVRGARLPAGVRNVRATYRFGAGAASPPYGGITQIVRGVPGLTRVRNPVAATGGADRETAAELRKAAPASALLLGRCVSLSDFSARVTTIPGVLNSKVELAWDDEKLAAVVKVWYVSAQLPDLKLGEAIVEGLEKFSEPGTLIKAKQAAPAGALCTLRVEIAVHPDYVAADVEKAVYAAYTDPETGMFATKNAQIGGIMSRSAIVAVARSVPGVLEVTALLNAFIFGPNPLGIPEPAPFPELGFVMIEGFYIDFTGDWAHHLTIRSVTTPQRDCCDLGT